MKIQDKTVPSVKKNVKDMVAGQNFKGSDNKFYRKVDPSQLSNLHSLGNGSLAMRYEDAKLVILPDDFAGIMVDAELVVVGVI